jgi:chemotaxis methyl-accepting protein methylase
MAASHSGEEPYTLAMFFSEQKEKQLKDWTVEITATDLNDQSSRRQMQESMGTMHCQTPLTSTNASILSRRTEES